MNPYQVLEISINASRDDVKRAFHRLAHRYHPDKLGGDAEKFKKISAAYALLKERAPVPTQASAPRSPDTVVVYHYTTTGFWNADLAAQMKVQEDMLNQMMDQMRAQQRWWGSNGTS